MSYLLKTRRESTQQKAASSEEQQRKIYEVRELLGELPTEMPGFLTDGTIRRFLRARKWSTEQATKVLKEAVKWRRQFKPDKICWDDLAGWENEARRAYIPDYVDKNGRTVVVIKTSIKSITKAKEQIKHLVYNLENIAMDSEDAQEDNVVWMCDFRGWTLSSTPLREARESLYIIQNYYPGLVAAAILSNPPRIFESFWKILKHFIEPTLNEKVKFVYTNNSESQRILADMFDLDKVESAFGGRNTDDLDIIKYAERMRRRDQIRGARMPANCNTSS
ncbi:SEC14 cytosolic factor-like [Phragmites australis]|uniref:SEC14 cytosolic factor-like n=1 Tax=Phragmites australis TaxID=29695 RepID=UPI002D772974|nr:SEC14 cytosolic factor-like [Phragmites australis]